MARASSTGAGRRGRAPGVCEEGDEESIGFGRRGDKGAHGICEEGAKRVLFLPSVQQQTRFICDVPPERTRDVSFLRNNLDGMSQTRRPPSLLLAVKVH